MQDPASVITQATAGKVKELAAEFEVSLGRMYELLSTDCPYPKCKRLIRKIARVNPSAVPMVKADMDALFFDLLTQTASTDVVELHKESFEAMQSVLEKQPKDVQRKEIREIIGVWTRYLAQLDREHCLSPVTAQAAIAAKRNGNGRVA
jgi:hypothetical protein